MKLKKSCKLIFRVFFWDLVKKGNRYVLDLSQRYKSPLEASREVLRKFNDKGYRCVLKTGSIPIIELDGTDYAITLSFRTGPKFITYTAVLRKMPFP